MLINIKENGKWGYYNSEKENVIPCRFCDSSDFIDGFAIVRTDYNSRYGVIDENGKVIIPFKYENIKRIEKGIFELYYSYWVIEKCLCNSNGMLLDDDRNVLCDDLQKYDIVYKIDSNLFCVGLDKHYGIIYNNKLIIEFDGHRQVDNVKCGLIQLSDGNRKHWLYNLKGEVLLEDYNNFNIAPNSYVIFFGGNKIGTGIADSKGTIILEPKYWDISYLHDNLFKLKYQKDFKEKSYEVLFDSSKNTFITETDTGRIEIPINYDWCGKSNGKYTIISDDFKFGIIDNNNTMIADCIYTEIKECINDIAIVKKEDKWQLLNLSNGNLSAEYSDISHLKGKYYKIHSHYYFGVIDQDDNLIVPARFNSDIELFDDGTFKVSKGYKPHIYRVIDKEGHLIIRPKEKNITLPKEIAWIHDYSEGYAIVENADNLKGAIDIYGNMTIPFKYRGKLSDFKSGESIVSVNFGSWGSNDIMTSRIDTEGKFICKYSTTEIHIECDCCLVFDFIENRAIAYDGKFWGLVDNKGRRVTEFIYNSITYLNNGYYKVENNGRYGIIDYSSKVYLPCKYLNVRLSDDGCFEAIIKEERWRDKVLESMIINRDGFIVVKCGESQITVNQEYDSISDFVGDYAKVISNNKWGLINNQGECVLPCKYDFIDEVVNRHVHVKTDGKDFIISLDSEDSFEIKDVKTALYYSDNCIVITDNWGALKVYGIINRNGDEIWNKGYDEIGPFRGEYAYLSRNEYPYRNKKYGIINRKGEIIIEPQYYSLKFNNSESVSVSVSPTPKDEDKDYKNVNFNNETVLLNGQSWVKLPGQYSHGRSFSDGVAAVAIVIEKDDTLSHYNKKDSFKWGFINADGDNVVGCVYDAVTDFTFGFSIVTLSRQKGLINNKGEIIIPLEYNDIVMVSKDYIKAIKDGKSGLINYKNEIIIPFNYSDILVPSEGLIPIKQNGLWGYIDYQNNLMIHTKYSSVHPFHEGLAAVFDNSFWKFIDKNGQEVVTVPKDFDVNDFQDGSAIISFIGNDGVTVTHKLLRNGHILIDGIEVNIDTNRIKRIYHFNDGLAKVIVDDSLGFIDSYGNVVISGIFDDVTDFKKGYAKLIDDNSKNLYINKLGNLVLFENNEPISFPLDYCMVKYFCPGLYLVKRKTDDFIGIVDKYSKIIVPFTEEDIRLVSSENDKQPYIQLRDEWDEDETRFIFYNLSGDRIIPNKGKHIIIKQNYGKTDAIFSSGLAAVSRDNLWGFINENGVEVIPCQFYDVESFDGEYCIVANDKYGKSIINKFGVMLFPYRKYGSISFADEGFEVTNSYSGKRIKYHSYDDRWEREWISEERKFNHDGELQVSLYGQAVSLPKNFEWSTPSFKEGFLSVQCEGKWGVVDTNLKIIIDCLYDYPIEFDDGLALVEEDDETYVFDTTGKLILSGKYKNVKRYKDEHMFVCLTADRTHFDIYRDSGELLFYSNDIKSRIIIPESNSFSTNRFAPNRIIPVDSNHLKFSISANYQSKKFVKWGLSDVKGTIILEAGYDDIGGFGSGLIAVCKEFAERYNKRKLWGYVNANGVLLIDYKYSEALPFSKGIAIVAKTETPKSGFSRSKYGIIGSNGKELTSFVYDSAKQNEKGIEVSDYSHNNRISLEGEILFSYYDDNSGWTEGHVRGYDWCSDGHKGFHVVTKGNLQGIIDDYGAETFSLTNLGQIQIGFDKEENLVFKQFLLGEKQINEKGQIISINNDTKIILPVGVHWCTQWNEGYLPVESYGKWGLLDSELNWIVEPYYDKIQYALNKMVLCVKNSESGKEIFIYDICKNEFKQLNYDDCSDFENGFAIVSRINKESRRNSNLYGLIDNNGCELLPCTYQNMQFKEPPKEEDHSFYSSHDSYEDYNDYERDTWDAMTDGMYGDMPDGFDGDYSFLGY